MGIGADPVPNLPAQQLVDRLAVCLAGNVPERLIERGDCGTDHRAALPEAVAVQRLPEPLHLRWVTAINAQGYVADRLRDSPFVALKRALAPAVYAFVGLDLDEYPLSPAALHEKGLYVRDFQMKLRIIGYTASNARNDLLGEYFHRPNLLAEGKCRLDLRHADLSVTVDELNSACGRAYERPRPLFAIFVR